MSWINWKKREDGCERVPVTVHVEGGKIEEVVSL